MSLARFPYKTYRGMSYPIIDLEIQNTNSGHWVPMEAFVDSGASFSIFSVNDSLRLGVHYEVGKRIDLTIGDGRAIPVYLHRHTLRIGTDAFVEWVGFSPKLGIGFNLLGQNIFNHFIVTFNNPAKTITFSRVKRKA